MNTQKTRMTALVLAAGRSWAAQAATTYSVTTLGASGGAIYGINASGLGLVDFAARRRSLTRTDELKDVCSISIFRLSVLTLALCFSTNGAWSAPTTAIGSSVITVNGPDVTLLSGSNLTVTDSNFSTGVTTKTQDSTSSLGQFNSSQGVLTNAVHTLSLPTTTTTLIRSGSDSSQYNSVTVTTAWLIGGASASTTLNTVQYPATSDTSWTGLSMTSSVVNLNNFVGTGNIDGVFNSSISAKVICSYFCGTERLTTATIDKSLIGSQSITYTYTDHSNASFTAGIDTNAFSHDFGQLNSGIGSDHGFSIFGLAGDLGLTGFTANFLSGDNVFAISGASGIGPGGSGSYNAHFNAQTPGVLTTYSGTYRITFTDDVSSLGGNFASNSVGTNYIDITLAASVPEPNPYAMLLAGLGLVGFAARRRVAMK